MSSRSLGRPHPDEDGTCSVRCSEQYCAAIAIGKLHKQRALVTGASGGIGGAIALALSREGAALVLVARDLTRLERVSELCRASGTECVVHVVDVSARRKVSELLSEIGPLDVLVNCAGIQGPIGPLVSNDLDKWEYALRVNLLGTLYTSRAVIPAMVRRGKGSIINMSGGGAVAARPNFSSYAVAKAGVVRLTETLAAEVSGSGVRVNAIAPGLVDTALLDGVLDAGASLGPEYQRVRLLRDKGHTESSSRHAAELAVFLASESSVGLTGKLISAVHDPWREWNADHIAKLAKSSWYTSRRMDPFTVGQLEAET